MTRTGGSPGRGRRAIGILRYVRPHWRGMTMVVASVALLSAAEVLVPFPLKVLVDNVLGEEPAPGALTAVVDVLPGQDETQGLLLLVCLAIVLIFVVSTVAEMVATVATTRLGQRMTFDLAADLFLHLQRLSPLFHGRRPVGDTIARVTGDSYGMQGLVTGVLPQVLQSLITLIAMFVIMLQLSPSLTLLALAVVPFQLVAIRVFSGPMRDRSRRRRDLEGSLLSVVQQTLTAVQAVQAFTREAIEHARFRAEADRTVVAYVREVVAASWFQLFAGLATAVGTAGIFYLGAQLALADTVTVGTVLVFLAYLAALYGPLNNIAYMASGLQEAGAQLDRVMEVLEQTPDVEDSPNARDARVRFGRVSYQDVTFAYDEDRPVAKGLSFEIEPGETVGIVGPTGAGKSTLARLLVRFFDPLSGRVLVDGMDLRELRINSLRQQVAMVLQEPFILPFTVAENIAYGRPRATLEDVVAAAEAASADQFIRLLPEGYGTVIGERGATLSGGEQQRLSIARAFLKDAPILVLDEPTSALDARTEAALLDTLDRLSKGRTTLIIAHRLSTIRNADWILVMDAGQIVERGRHAELIAAGGLYATLYNQQMAPRRPVGAPAPASGSAW